MKTRSLLLCLLASILPGSCLSVQTLDLEGHGERHGLELSQEGAPEGALPLSILHARKSGFYLFALIPLVSADMDDCMHELARKARAIEADGICGIEVGFEYPVIFSLSGNPFPWTAAASLTGMAWRRKAVEGRDRSPAGR